MAPEVGPTSGESWPETHATNRTFMSSATGSPSQISSLRERVAGRRQACGLEQGRGHLARALGPGLHHPVPPQEPCGAICCPPSTSPRILMRHLITCTKRHCNRQLKVPALHRTGSTPLWRSRTLQVLTTHIPAGVTQADNSRMDRCHCSRKCIIKADRIKIWPGRSRLLCLPRGEVIFTDHLITTALRMAREDDASSSTRRKCAFTSHFTAPGRARRPPMEAKWAGEIGRYRHLTKEILFFHWHIWSMFLPGGPWEGLPPPPLRLRGGRRY